MVVNHTHYQLPITDYPLPITHYQLPITHYPLPITKSIPEDRGEKARYSVNWESAYPLIACN
ncbi:hypothetical protein [Fischerella thermalis]|uniref:hypothetical protein n=1 Tax=Fischerella thermalis TaxID=372787 RepID=UPI00307E6DD9